MMDHPVAVPLSETIHHSVENVVTRALALLSTPSKGVVV